MDQNIQVNIGIISLKTNIWPAVMVGYHFEENGHRSVTELARVY